jgi:hypothetical protein
MLLKRRPTMSQRISKQAQGELVGALRERYRASKKGQKTKILDEFVILAGFHRKHAIRLLRGEGGWPCPRQGYGRRIYDEAVRVALVVLW